ncbi:DUF4249 family protein [Lewinella sp. W8]|uniref:DUF4249 family protein n=1 Tax=Lewinella sp. W8 TaxID=2528208 RepID=UPI00106797C6|nr:DUF4249 family protein [Lewinella sp. W8]MTB53329.1 DUF4249 family protein [Lewinella sp. W8]
MRHLLLLLLPLLLLSCRDDFTLEADFEDIPVAYGFLNAEDDRHFVRVERAFLEAGGNATVNAGISDSIYYGPEDATVVLENLRTLESTEMARVNGENFGLDREDGVFATSPNILYSIEDQDLGLQPGDNVRLTISRPGEEDAVAETVLLQPLDIRSPGDQIRPANYNRPLIVSWIAGPNAVIYDVKMIFNIREFFPADPSQNRNVQLEWTINNAYVPNDQSSAGQVRFEVNTESIYRFIGQALPEDDAIVRRFDDFDIQVAAGGAEVLDRRRLENANVGVTSSQSLPRYTNLSGGIGMITSQSFGFRDGILFDGEGQDSLRNGQYTRRLNFQ